VEVHSHRLLSFHWR